MRETKLYKVLADSDSFNETAEFLWARASHKHAAALREMAEETARGEVSRTLYPDFSVESPLAIATYQYFVSLELLLKTLIAIAGGFGKIPPKHDLNTLYGLLNEEDRSHLEDFYEVTAMNQCLVEVMYEPEYAPANWHEDEVDLNHPSLEKFFRFFCDRKWWLLRYGFEDIDKPEWRVVLRGDGIVREFRSRVRQFVEKRGSVKRLRATLSLGHNASGRTIRMTSKAQYEFDRDFRSRG